MSRGLKQWKPIIHLAFIILISYIISLKSTQIITVKKITKFRPDMRNILLWTKIPGLEKEGQATFIDRHCENINCYVISNRTFLNNLGHYDAILFNLQDLSAETHDLPDVRSSTQKYIFVANDSSDNYPICDPVYDRFFNWTWSYKHDSTIAYKYITYRNNDDEILGTRFKWMTGLPPISALVKGQLTSKSKAAAIFMDKCKTRSEREVYVKNLQAQLAKYNLTVDIFGECGPMKCKRKTMTACFWRLRHQYFFYLAMEDSIAKDYITQEVLYAYKNYAVPIVYGGASYKDYLPPNSYLSAVLLNEEMMAKAIYDIIRNQTRYHDFFRWRNHYTVEPATGMEPCALCKALNNAYWLTYHSNHGKFRKWWNPTYESRCFKRSWLPFMN